MEPTTSTSDPAGASSCGGATCPAPFLLKTYDMIDDSSTNDIVSWSTSNTSFIVWNPPEFSFRLLPTYFKHNNFSSFIRQLNTYGFRKIDPERWEFANDEFLKGHKHMLKNIQRRKPIHSHSNPPLGIADSERITLEEEIERLQREKTALQADLWLFKQQQSGTEIQLDDLERRLLDMEQRQAKMIDFLQRAVQNPKFVENLVRMAGSSASTLHRKRRLPAADCCADVVNSIICENSSSSLKPAEISHLFSQDFCDKLKLELSPAYSETNMVSPSNQGSNDGNTSPLMRLADDDCPLRLECLQLVPENLELSDTGASFCPRKNLLVTDDGDEPVSCHFLNLTLASSTSNYVNRAHGLHGKNDITKLSVQNRNVNQEFNDKGTSPLREASQAGKQALLPANARVNDKFWEQFLTERPGSSDTEEASSSLREDILEEPQEERNRKDTKNITL